MRKWSYGIIGLLLVGLVAGIAVPAVMASRASNPSGEAASTAGEAELAEFAAALQEADQVVTDNNEEVAKGIKLLEVTLGGAFKGEWGTDNAEDVDPTGSLTGIYGKVKRADNEVNYFRGVWLAYDGSIFAYLRGTCSDIGTFTGVWRNAETGVGGPLTGTFSPVSDDNVTVGDFNGTWETTDGEQSGYLHGSWSPAISVERDGRFGGRWVNDTQLAASCQGARFSAKCKARDNAECTRAGRIWGGYGHITLADNTTIQYFLGKWHAANSRLHGRLGGLAIDGKFYGIWGGHKKGCRAGGYLTGDYSYDSQLEKDPKGAFEGVWGRFGQEQSGLLKGKFGPLGVSEPFADQEF